MFQQDSAAQHATWLRPGCLTKKTSDGALRWKTWPPQSHDLNPVEMVDETDHEVKAKASTDGKWTALVVLDKGLSITRSHTSGRLLPAPLGAV